MLTGATGFFGIWLLGSLLHATGARGAAVRATVLTRRPDAVRAAFPALFAHPAVTLVEGDVRRPPPLDGCTAVVHGAAPTVVEPTAAARRDMASTIVEGTRAVLARAEAAGAGRLLVVSSGAVYGTRTRNDPFCAETDPPALPDDPGKAAYAAAKLEAEALAAGAAAAGRIQTVIARCFAFVGPGLPLHQHFAVGNFVADALAGRAVAVRGDGRAVRSYMYGSDLAVWLWTLLSRGAAGRAYNVGSDEPVTIAALAHEVARLAGSAGGVVVAEPPSDRPDEDWYVPLTARAHDELGLQLSVTRTDAIARTLAWHRRQADRDER